MNYLTQKYIDINEKLRPNTALLVIDMQNDFLDENGIMAKRGKPIEYCQQVIDPVKNMIKKSRCLKNNIVIWIRGIYNDENSLQFKYPLCINDTWGAEIIDELKLEIHQDDYLVEKKYHSSFRDTQLERILKINNIVNVFIMGLITEICCYETYIDAVKLGYRSYMIESCVGSRHPQIAKEILSNVSIL